jgi:hypothetical protein
MKPFRRGLRAASTLAYATAAFLLVGIGEGQCAAAAPNQAAFDPPEVCLAQLHFG